MLRASDVSVAFDDRTILDRVNVNAAAGEIVVLLGPSGSGKSTLLRVIAGIVPVDGGCVEIDGLDVTDAPTHRRSVGMVFQDEQLFPHLDVGSNIEFGLKMHGVAKPERRRRTMELLQLVGLDGFAERSIDRLSGGEAKRVALARSLAPRPQLLLLDEPLSGLDRDLRMRLAADLVAVLRSTGTTSVWVTHDEEEADAVADRIVHLGDLGSQP